MQLDDNGSAEGGQSAEPVASAWAAFAAALATHFLRLQNREDVHGRYVPLQRRKRDPMTGRTLVSYTAHFVLTIAHLVRHFVGKDQGHLVGLHLSSPEATCRWVVVDFDANGEGDDAAANLKMATAVYHAAIALGFDVLLLDSNGKGGFHLWVVFASPISMADAWRLGKWLVRDFVSYGLTKPPETFPKSPRLSGKRIGSWVRLPGRHHTREHWTLVWDGEGWLGGEQAIELILAVTGKDVDIASVIPPDFEPRKSGSPKRLTGVVSDPALNPADRRSDIAMGLAEEPSERRIATVREALGHLGDEYRDDYDSWLGVGMALRQLGGPGLALWHEWSEPSEKYRPEDLDAKWSGFKSADENADGKQLTVGSLFHWAKEHGWPEPARRVRGVTRHRGRFVLTVSHTRVENNEE